MSLPDFNAEGDLPIGVHLASLAEISARFGTASVRRKMLARRLQRIHEIAASTGELARFVVFGTFITNKLEPNDVDIFMIMNDNLDLDSLVGPTRLLFVDHRTAQDHFGASVFWIRRLAAFGGEQLAIEDWQIKRDGTERGIVEVIEDRQ